MTETDHDIILELQKQVEQLEKERDTYAELAANKCVIQKVNDELGQQTLTSVANYRAGKERIEHLQEEVEDLAHSLLQALQGEKNAIHGFKAGLSAAAKQNGRIKELEAQVQKLGEQLDDSNRLELE